ncbi:error-prone DNA polymerase [Neptunomonas marina]|uniref:Error-prone DNA polymerase n=1 Tax=Neptunomonas marina TaxID=1815562 RepID=A0A437QA49_9GAMM|nr:error-prone DNA polymerase [Neptunomonas marina]RVU31438.1 DNA polymerase III subunit alpha [Neptunomonas marina]
MVSAWVVWLVVAPFPYAELHVLSNFSFLRGASHPEELVARAAELGYQALALTDECSVAGVVRAWEEAKAQQIKLIIGSVFRLDDEQVILLACNRRGYGQLCELITQARRRAEKGKYQVTWDDFAHQPDCLLLYLAGDDLNSARRRMAHLKTLFPKRLWWMVSRLLSGDDQWRFQQQCRIANQLGVPLVCGNRVEMHSPARQPLHDVLAAIREQTSIQQAGYLLAANGEQHLRSFEKLTSLYPADMLAATVDIAVRCCFELSELRYEYPAELVPEGRSAAEHLRALVQRGQRLRFPEGVPDAIAQQIERELHLIAELGYEHYFLTIEDIVRFARQQGILCQGRGSAANSVVCYCLHITEADPREVSLLIERFISKERDEPPDIDVDFEHERREEVIQYIYQRYGRERAGLAATVISYRTKSAIRDVGKALGMDESYLSWIIAQLERREGREVWLAQLAELGGEEPSPLYRHFVALVEEILGFPRHLSQHVGGFVIAAQALCQLVPIENAAMTDRTVIQWNKDDLESLGLLKVDVLALGMLTAIRKTLCLLAEQGEPVTRIQDIPRGDSHTYDMLCRGDSMGVFQVESRAQMNMLPRLRPRSYYDLVIEVAIVRPGPIQGDMVHPYLTRRQQQAPISYPSPEVEQVLKRTLGVPIFQEQVIQLAMVAAGFSGGEADQLRRAMAAWRRSGYIREYQQKLMEGMQARGYEREFAERICRQIEGFGEYGFPESHAASFALLVYISAWLKCHYPVQFCCGLLNSQPLGFYSPAQLIQDLQRHGAEVEGVDINLSTWDSSVVVDGTKRYLRLGFRLIKGLRYDAVAALLGARQQGAFRSLQDARRRCQLRQQDWDALAAAGALNSIAGHRFQARWELLAPQHAMALDPLTHVAESRFALAAPDEKQDVEEDYRHLGLSLGRHPLALLRAQGELQGCKQAEQLKACRHGQLVTVAGLVTNRQRPGTATGVTFVTLEDETGQINLVVWRDTAKAQRKALLTAQLLQVSGVLECEGDVIHVVAGKLRDISEQWRELTVKSRDFC